MTSELKNLILEEVNSYRNLIATGKANNFPAASNMRQVYWNKEMEFLSRQLLIKLPFAKFSCTKTETFPKTAEFHYRIGSVTNIECVTKAFQFLKDTRKSNFGFIYADYFTRIGCSLATYTKGGLDLTLLKCVHNAGSKDFTYVFGEPCTKCELNQSCSHLFEGLCEERVHI